MVLSAGTRLGPYEVTSVVGAGGMGEVYRARDTRLQRDVAIKILPTEVSSDADRLRRFEHEALAVAALNHPNILAIHDVGSHEGAPYVVTELLEGQTLRQQLSGGALPVAKVLRYALQLAEGLTAAHEKGIVHRDLKPENIFVTADDRVKILDFGLAKLTTPFESSGEAPTAAATAAGAILGTVGYMSPEQVRGLATDCRSDIFSFGAVLYELISGRRAFKASTPADTLSIILKEDPPRLTSPNEAVPAALRLIAQRCLHKSPAERFQSARDVAIALSGVVLPGPDVSPRIGSTVRRPDRRIAVMALMVVVVAALGYVVSRFRPATAPTRLRIAVAQQGTVSFIIGSGIADILNEASRDVRATVLATNGAVAAVRHLDAGDTELALANNQLAFHAVKTDRLLGHRSTRILGAAVLFAVPVHVLVRRDAHINSMEDLRGKRVSLGLESSGERFTAERLLENFELKAQDVTARYLDIDQALAELRQGTIDACIAGRGLPHAAIANAMATGNVRLLSIDRERVDGIRVNEPFMLPFTIPRGTYPRQESSVTTVATRILLLASTSIPDTTVEHVLQLIATHIPDLIARHPTASEIDLRQSPSVANGMSIDLHPGAAKFYQRSTRE